MKNILIKVIEGNITIPAYFYNQMLLSIYMLEKQVDELKAYKEEKENEEAPSVQEMQE